MKISLIVCAYNEEKYIKECLEAAIANSAGKFCEIIVVDNNSTDQTKAITEKIPGVTMLTESRKGPNHARQKGFEAAAGDILAFIDADTRMPSGWADILIDEFRNNQKLCCLSGPYIFYDFSKWKNFLCSLYWHLLAYPTYLALGYMVVGGNFAIRKDTLSKMNGFNTSIKFYGDDTDLARRAILFGKVKFKLNFAIRSSARRLAGQGMLKTAYLYTLNFFSQIFVKRSITNSYLDIR